MTIGNLNCRKKNHGEGEHATVLPNRTFIEATSYDRVIPDSTEYQCNDQGDLEQVERAHHVTVQGDSAELQLGARLGSEVNPQSGEETGLSENLDTTSATLISDFPYPAWEGHEFLLSFATGVLHVIRAAYSLLILSGS